MGGGTKYPEVYSAAVIDDYTNWVKVSGSFIADSAYQFIQIGNFLIDSLTTITNSASPSAIEVGAYYYIDDICVSSDSSDCLMATSINSIKPSEQIKMFPNPVSDQLHIQSPVPISELTLYNPLGQCVLHGFNQTDISVKELPSGYYFLQIKTLNHYSYYKIVVN